MITISHIVKCTNAWICFKGFMGSESVCVFVQENLFANQYFGIGFDGDDDAGVELHRAVVVRPLFGVNRRRFLREVCPCDDGDGAMVCVCSFFTMHTHTYEFYLPSRFAPFVWNGLWCELNVAETEPQDACEQYVCLQLHMRRRLKIFVFWENHMLCMCAIVCAFGLCTRARAICMSKIGAVNPTHKTIMCRCFHKN